MKPLEASLPGSFSDALKEISSRGMNNALDGMERIQAMEQRREEAGLRKFFAGYLVAAGSVVLVFSLFMVVSVAWGWAKLPPGAVATLIGSVAVEFVGMLWLVVRYLFR